MISLRKKKPRTPLRQAIRPVAYFIVQTKYCSFRHVQKQFGYDPTTIYCTIDILQQLNIVGKNDGIHANRRILVSSIEDLEGKLDILFH